MSDKHFGAYKINNKLMKQGFNISIEKTYNLLSTIKLPTIFTKKPNFRYYKSDNDINFTNILKTNFTTSALNKAEQIYYQKLKTKQVGAFPQEEFFNIGYSALKYILLIYLVGSELI